MASTMKYKHLTYNI